MSYSVQDAKTDLEGILHGTTNSQITNLDQIFNRTARTLLLDVDPQETKRIVQFAGPIFNTVFDYPIATDLKGNGIVDVRPQIKRMPRDVFGQQYNQNFDVSKNNVYTIADSFTINFNTGIKTIRVNAPFLPTPLIINQAENITENGTWSVGGTASNLTVNNQNFVSGAGALQYDIATGTGYVENSTMSAVNLTAHLNQSTLFTYVYMPTGSQYTSVTLRWGSSASNYYEVTTSVTQQNTTFQNGWNLLAFPWLGATVVGSPDVTAINYLRVTSIVTANQTASLLDSVSSILGNILEYEYYSKYLFRDAITGAFQETVTNDSNLINLDTESYNLFFNLLAHFATQQQQGLSALFYDGTFFGQQYQEGIAKYKGRYKSELQKPQSMYYRQQDNSYSRFRRWNT